MNEYWQARIEKKQTMLDAVDDALTTLLTGNVESYSLDTGQGVQKVTRLDIDMLRRLQEKLEADIATLHARANGGSVRVGVPTF